MKQDLKDEAASDFEKILEKKLKERDEIVKRELNLIFWGVPESISDDNSVRCSQDSDFVLRVGQAMGVQDIKIALDRDLKMYQKLIKTNQEGYWSNLSIKVRGAML